MGYIFLSIQDFPGNDNSQPDYKIKKVVRPLVLLNVTKEQEMFGYSRYPLLPVSRARGAT